eukprot:g4457.t1
MYSKDAQKAMTFISIYARVPGKQDVNQDLIDFMKNPQQTTWNALCGTHPSAATAPVATAGGNVMIISKEIREAWLAIREACHTTESFWDFLFEQADCGHLPDDMIKELNGRTFMEGRWFRRAGNFRKLVEPLAEANLAYIDQDAVYANVRPGRFARIENMRQLNANTLP